MLKHETTWMNIKTTLLNKGSKEKTHTAWFHSYECQEQANVIYDLRRQNKGCLQGGHWPEGGPRKPAGVMGIFCHGRGTAYTSVRVCQSGTDCTRKMGAFLCVIYTLIIVTTATIIIMKPSTVSFGKSFTESPPTVVPLEVSIIKWIQTLGHSFDTFAWFICLQDQS